MKTLWRIYDPHPASMPGCLPIEHNSALDAFQEAHQWNSLGWGIFSTVNDFKGPRKIENLISLRAWYVECDGGDKPKMLKRLMSGLTPSRIIESKRGYHAYWNCKAASLEKYKDILEFRLIPYYEGDLKAKDVARILREPDFFHCKNPNEKFLIKKIWEKEVSYQDQDLEYFYKLPPKKEIALEGKDRCRQDVLSVSKDRELFEKVYGMNCELALNRLSGTSAMGGESISFKKASRGRMNILIDGKSTSCFLDAQKRIGSSDHGGPTIWQWINWYHHDHKKTYAYMKEYFPELWD